MYATGRYDRSAYSSTINNGQIANSVDGVSGETITYSYDALKRLISALSTQNWTENYTYDGFGNLTGMAGTGGAPSVSPATDPSTNRVTVTGAQYDNNGNLTQGPGGTFGYDVANRIVTLGGQFTYAYDSNNRRIYYRSTSGTDTIYLYGGYGEKLGVFTISGYSGALIQLAQQSANVYFAGQLVYASGVTVGTDSLGSVRFGNGVPNRTYYPYGQEYSTTANDMEKYATYTRDSLTGMDYAVNRYYSSKWGRFLSPDSYSGSIKLGSPQTWNRYAYVVGDPMNANDPFGLCQVDFNGMLTGPSAACNTVAATAWSQAMDTWTTYTPGTNSLSQSVSITQVDLGAQAESFYAQAADAFFWTGVLGLAESIDDGTVWTGVATGICQDVANNPGALKTCQDNVFALSGGIIGCILSDAPCSYVDLVMEPPKWTQSPPEPYVLGSLTLPFAPNPTAPTCQSGYHPDPHSDGSYGCLPNAGSHVIPIRVSPPPRKVGPR
jgi:RHS repeat-associated protein